MIFESQESCCQNMYDYRGLVSEIVLVRFVSYKNVSRTTANTTLLLGIPSRIKCYRDSSNVHTCECLVLTSRTLSTCTRWWYMTAASDTYQRNHKAHASSKYHSSQCLTATRRLVIVYRVGERHVDTMSRRSHARSGDSDRDTAVRGRPALCRRRYSRRLCRLADPTRSWSLSWKWWERVRRMWR